MRRGRGEKKALNETNDDYRMVNTLAEAEPNSQRRSLAVIS